MKRYSIALLLTFLFMAGCKIQPAKNNEVNNAMVVNYCDYKLIDSIGIFLIPELIDSIASCTKSIIGYIEPTSSNIPDFQIDNYLGINYAYNIEHILGLNTLISERNDILDSTDCGYKIYEFGVILKKEKGVVQYKSLDYADMVKIQSLYKEWWNNNKNKSLETLQIEWQNGIKPIPDESEYIWK